MDSIHLKLENGYTIKSISIDDCKIVEKLCIECSDYFILHDGTLPNTKDIKGIFFDLPPNKGYEDKFVLGIFTSQNKLIGIVDIVRDYPTVGEWMLGLMLIAPNQRNNGLGTTVHKIVSDWAMSLGAKSFRIGVIQENDKGNKFWSRLGYINIKEIDMEFTAKKHKVNVMRLKFCN